MSKTILLIATRPPYGQMQGHKMALRTYVKSLQRLGHRVVVAAFRIPGELTGTEDLDARTYYLDLPSKAQVVRAVFSRGLRGVSLNECLYYNVGKRREIAEVVQKEAVSLVIADMIRTAPYADETGLPWILDLDDLLSDRYHLLASGTSGSESILGYLENVIPSGLRRPARWTFRKLLRREARVVATRELYWIKRSRASSLRSLSETLILQRRIPEAHIFCLPVSVEIPPQPADRLRERPMTAVFTGGLTYQPNLEAIRFYISKIIPEFEHCNVQAPTLSVIGNAPTALRQELQHPAVRFLGHVDDLYEELCKAQVFFAPIVSGTGIKVKVLEALACGLPVIALPVGLAGLNGEAGRDYLQAENETQFVQQYVDLHDNAELAETMGRAARKLALSHYTLDATSAILRQELDAL